MMELVLFATLIASTQSNFHVHLGDTTTCAAYNGEVKCWGDNNYGQLGVDYNTGDELEPLPDPIDLGTDFFADTVGCGGSHCCAVSTAKELKCWGSCSSVACDYSTFGQGVGDSADDGGEMAKLEPYSYVPGLVDVVTLWYMTCVLHQGDAGQNEIECIGYDANGKGLPVGEVPLDDVDWSPSGVGGGYYTLCAFDSATAGALKCFGAVAVNIDVSTLLIESLQCGRYHCCALTVERSLTCWGDDYNVGQWDTSQIPSDFGAVQDYAMSEHSTCVLSADGNVVCFGEDVAEQLGGGSFVISSEFTDDGVRLAHSAPATAQYCLYEEASSLLLQCWGFNSHGQLGYGDKSNREMGDDLEFVQLGWTVDEPPTGTGCDAASFTASGCTEGTNCLLDNGRMSGECCTTDFQCLEGEGDCDEDDDCAGSLLCGTDNCGSPFQDTHDCCTSSVSAHYVAIGSTLQRGKIEGDEDYLCQRDDDNQAKYWSNKHGYDIAVSCCSEDGEDGWRYKPSGSNNKCNNGNTPGNHPKTWQEAYDICAAKDGYRLCTRDEMLDHKTKGEGCWYDAAYNWVSTPCEWTEDGHGALVNARQQSDPLAVENESGSNGDPAGNGLADLSATSLIGAAIGIVAVLAIAVGIVSVVKRRKRAAMEAETRTAVQLGMDKAAVDSAESVTAENVAAVTVHVDEVPSSEVAEATTTADAGNTESV